MLTEELKNIRVIQSMMTSNSDLFLRVPIVHCEAIDDSGHFSALLIIKDFLSFRCGARHLADFGAAHSILFSYSDQTTFDPYGMDPHDAFDFLCELAHVAGA